MGLTSLTPLKTSSDFQKVAMGKPRAKMPPKVRRGDDFYNSELYIVENERMN